MKKKIVSNLLGTLAVLGFIVLFGITVGKTAYAEEQSGNVSVTLHKQKFTEDKAPMNNSGVAGDSRFNGTSLNGITFNAYDVTAEYYAKVTGSQESSADAISEIEKLNAASLESKSVGEAVTADKGTAKFDLPAKSGDKDAVYLFVEASEPGASGNSEMVLVLPAYKPIMEGDNVKFTDEVNTDIHLYPKNKVIDRKITIKAVGTDDATRVLDGSEFTLQTKQGTYYTGNKNGQENGDWSKSGRSDPDLTTNVAQFGDESQKATIKVKNGVIDFYGLLDGDYLLKEVTTPTNYGLTTDAASISFTVTNGQLAKEYVIEDFSTLGDPANGFTDATHTGEADTMIVENRALGNLTFDKVDANTNSKLSGAAFKIAKTAAPNPDYLYKKDQPAAGDYLYAWGSELTDKTGWTLVTLTSTNGTYSLSGLKLGDYFVQETTAPDGYALPNGDSSFTKLTVSSAGATASVSGGIKNVHKGILPSTGGKGIYLFILIGVIALILAGYYFSRGRKKFEA
ncbi:MAG: pilin N-terminal domain-containing protein [Enterococcus gilvus]